MNPAKNSPTYWTGQVLFGHIQSRSQILEFEFTGTKNEVLVPPLSFFLGTLRSLLGETVSKVGEHRAVTKWRNVNRNAQISIQRNRKRAARLRLQALYSSVRFRAPPPNPARTQKD
jgi:hypothetical protein